jgi:hypothetical protein
VTTKRSLGLSPFQFVYGTKAVFPPQLALPMANFFQDCQAEPDDMIRRIHQREEGQQTREKMMDETCNHHQRIKKIFDRNRSKEDFHVRDPVLKWDAPG